MNISSTLIGNTLLSLAPIARGGSFADDALKNVSKFDKLIVKFGSRIHFGGNSAFNLGKRRLVNSLSTPLRSTSEY
ncbi:hypothetical protein [Ascidiimonas aurantiaca]|uniref:hypothetical protein n=1 Tax=Ascidiimonas aurantiaca TaxID=1685432 RepID=UPI0030EBB7A0